MRVLLIGATGQLGRHLEASAPASVSLSAPPREHLDLTDGGSVESALTQASPQVVINAAAYTGVDAAEADRTAAFELNAEGPRRLAESLARTSARLIHISTDFVFDGARPTPYRPEDPTAPLNVYGASKLAGEQAVLNVVGDRALVVRTSWLYSSHRTNFVKTMLAALDERDEVKVVTDQIGSPTWAAGLATAVWRWALDAPGAAGIRHWADAGVASWYDLAVAIAEEGSTIGLLGDPGRVTPISTAEFPTAARRPPQSALDASLSRAELGLEAEHWRRALRRMLSAGSERAALAAD